MGKKGDVMPIMQPTLDGRQLILVDVLFDSHPFNNKLAVKYHLRSGPEGKRCKDCAHHYIKSCANTYHKCDQVMETNGPGTDIRVGWQACERFTQREVEPC